jgi:uncharacterized membrane protein
MSGMAIGLFATLLTGTIITQIASLCGYNATAGADNAKILVLIYGVGTILKSLMGFGIGIGMAIGMGFGGLSIICVALGGAVATMFTNTFSDGIMFKSIPAIFSSGNNNDPVIVYCVVIVVALLVRLIWKKRTPFDIIVQPLFCVAVAIIATWCFSPIITFILKYLGEFIRWTMNGTNGNAPLYQKLLFSALISAVVGVILTAPISSAAICISINLSGLGAGAAVVGCCCQMVGFAVQSLRDNKVGIFFASLFGTSMIFFPNLIRKPLAWLPTIIASIILAPLATLFFEISSSSVGAGMGTCGLVGVLQTLEYMQYSWKSFLAVGLFCLALPAGLVFGLDLLFRKVNLIKKGDLAIIE